MEPLKERLLEYSSWDEEEFAEEKLMRLGIMRAYQNDDLERCEAELIETIFGGK